jgi:ABC-type multidrug transport system ATPase subunit
MSEVEELCTVITVINHGRVVFAGGVDELRMLAPAAVHRLRTSDDHAALDIASGQHGMKVRIAREQDGGLDVSADTDALDAYVITLARAGVAVRTLERRARSLESLFLELTGHADAIDEAASVSRDASQGARVSAGVS